MAVKTYYGTCITAADASEKEVIIQSEAIATNDFTLNIGDLLVVFFKNSNTAENPSIVISNNDTEVEVSISDDTGKKIKTRSIEVDAVGAWDAGETVVFAYTHNTNDIDNNYYWELINGAPSTEDIYGVTKLFGNSNTSISQWLSQPINNADFNKALTPGILKKFYSLLIGQEEEEGGEDFSNLKLTWFPKNEQELEMIELGMLSLTDDINQGITINYPLNSKIVEVVKAQPKETFDIPAFTKDIINNGHAIEDTDEGKADGEFYITNIIPNGKALYYTDSPEPYKFLVPYENNNLLLNSKGGIQLNGVNGTTVNNGLTLNGNLNMPTGTISSGAINCSTLTTTGIINAGANQIKTTGRLDGKTIYENGVSLNIKYSGKLLTRRLTYKNISIAKGGGTAHLYQAVAYSGYTPIGIVGINLDQVNTSQNASYCHLWEWSLQGNNIQFAIRNYKNSAVKINAVFDVLYVKNV